MPVLDTEVKIRLAAPERAAWEREAAQAGVPLSTWMRYVLNAAAGEDALTEAVARARAKARQMRAMKAGSAPRRAKKSR